MIKTVDQLEALIKTPKLYFFTGLDYWRAKLTRQSLTPWLIHGGTARQDREKATVLPWDDLSPLLNNLA